MEQRLDWLLDQNPMGSTSAPIAIALERVQGSLRMALEEAEKNVLLNRVAPRNEWAAPPAAPQPAAPQPTVPAVPAPPARPVPPQV